MSKKIILILLLILHLFLLINLQFTAWPEVLTFPYLMSKGFVLYKDMIHVYPPLLNLILVTVYKIFGFKLLTLQVFTWLFILVNDLLLFSLVKKVSGKAVSAYLALLVYVLLQPVLQGNMLWYDTALVTPILASLYFYLVKKNLWLVGVSLAAAILIKQTAGVYVLVFLGYLLSQKIDVKKIIWPLIILAGVLGVYLFATNSVGQFINWNFYYPLVYWNRFPGYVQMTLTRRDFLILALLFFPLLVSAVQHKVFGMWLLIAVLVMVYPRFSYFHLQPALVLLVIWGSGIRKWQYGIYLTIIIFGLSLPTVKSLWGRETSFYSSIEISQASHLQEIVKPEEKVYLLGAFSSLYMISDRLPPKIWTDNFGWYLEIPGVQQKILNSWEGNRPKYIVWQQTNSYQPKLITDWITRNYSKIGEFDHENSLYQLLPE